MVERDASSSSQHDKLEDNVHGADRRGEENAWSGQIGLDVLNSYES